MANKATRMKSAMRRTLFVPAGLLLAISPFSYHARELLTCWLFFGLLLVSITPLILGTVLACYAGRWIIRWAWEDPRMKVTPTLGLSVSPLGPSPRAKS